MKPVSNILHSTPWWALLGGGLGLFVALVLFTTPFHLISYEQAGATPAENRAIKREIDSAFSEGAIDLARGVVKEMRDHTKDPARREELERALEEIDDARQNLREAGAEILRAKRDAANDVSTSVKEATAAIEEAQRQAARALKEAGVDGERVNKSLEESLKAARAAQEEARQAAAEARLNAQEKAREAREKARQAQQKAKEQPHGAPGETASAAGEPRSPRVVIIGPGSEEPLLDIDMSKGEPSITPLPAQLKQEIRRKVTGDLYRIGLGAGLILIFIPLFVLLVVSKFFIDRARASQRVAEVKRKEADYHRMSQQVTEAKLSALQAQVEPHFLYNTLASVQALTEVDPQQANAMTGHLIQYLRNALPKMRESVSTVGQEIELVRAYLNILQMRMGKRLAFEIAVPADLMEAPFPPLMLPSLVENAIKHGLEPQREGGMVTISAHTEGGRLRLTVADTGRGFSETLGTGVGLTNIRERLAALYGDAAKLTLEANSPRGEGGGGAGEGQKRG
ncbi:MAG: histidine kinase [Burkholderiales bacterium]|nr:histidine kinase [Burkholderiales bacterium]